MNKKILVFADTHKRIDPVIKVIEMQKDIDLIIHLGDLVDDAEDIHAVFQDIPIECVSGNNDYFSNEPSEKILDFGGKRIFMAHGHTYRVKYDYYEIIKRGKEVGADIILFGHTHASYEDISQGILILNPGSISLPRNGLPSYGIIEIRNEKIYSMICNIKIE